MLGDVLDAQVNVVEVAVGAELLDVVNAVHAQKLAGEADHRSAANARSAKVLDLILLAFLFRVDQSCARSHAHHDGLVKAGEIESSDADGGKFRNGVAGKVIDGLCQMRSTCTRGVDARNIG